MPIRDDDPRPAYQQLADELREAIASGRYQVGDRLPSTRELSESNGIALMTVRAAVGLLEDENLVVARQGRGVFVTATPEPPAGPAGPGDLAAVRQRLDAAMKMLQQIGERLDRSEAAERSEVAGRSGPVVDTEPATPARGAERGSDTLATLDAALDDIRAANAALDARDAAGTRPAIDHHIDPEPLPPERGPDLDIGM